MTRTRQEHFSKWAWTLSLQTIITASPKWSKNLKRKCNENRSSSHKKKSTPLALPPKCLQRNDVYASRTLCSPSGSDVFLRNVMCFLRKRYGKKSPLEKRRLFIFYVCRSATNTSHLRSKYITAWQHHLPQMGKHHCRRHYGADTFGCFFLFFKEFAKTTCIFRKRVL